MSTHALRFVAGGMKRPAEDDMENQGGAPKRFCQGEGPNIELRILIMSKVQYFDICKEINISNFAHSKKYGPLVFLSRLLTVYMMNQNKFGFVERRCNYWQGRI